MATLVVDYTFGDPKLANPDGTLETTATGCTVVDGPGSTAMGTYPKALSFGASGKAKVDLPLDKLNASKFCIRTAVRVDAAVSDRENLVESAALPFSMNLQPLPGGNDFKAVTTVAPVHYGWSGPTSEFATTLTPGEWYTIDLVYDTDTVGVAIDGNVLAVVAFPDGTIEKGSSRALYIGTWVDGARNHFSGSMAALQLYDGIPEDLEALLDEHRSSPQWFITYKHQAVKASLPLGAAEGPIAFDAVSGAYVQHYVKGLIMYAEAIGTAFEMHGSIYDAYSTLPNRGELGFLVSDEHRAATTGARKNLFTKGGMYWSGGTGAVPVVDQIYLDYELLGESAAIGLPVSAATAVPGGSEQVFQRARMYQKTGAPKAHEVHGAILARFLATGALHSWGFPVSNEEDVRNGGNVLGRMSEFERCTIYWRSGVGAFEVHGDIRARYLALNGPLGKLGFPTSDERNIPGAPAPARCNSFQHGSILWFGSYSNMFVSEPFRIYLGRLDTQESEGMFMGQNDLYFRVIVEENGHQILSKRFPDSGDYGGHNIINIDRQLPHTVTPNAIDRAIKITFDIWESDSGAPFGGGDDHLGTHSETLSAANAWGFRHNAGLMNTGRFHKVNSLTWAVQPVGVALSALSEAEKWWGTTNRGTAKLSYDQYGSAFADVDSAPEDWDVTDWLEKAFYSLVVEGVAAGGNCFGMSLQAIYAWKHRSRESLPLNRFTRWNEIVGDVNVKHEYQVGAEAIWWFVQEFLKGETHDPVSIFRETRSAFSRGDHPVLCLAQNYDFSGSPHCVMPAGIWDDSSKPWKLKIYDPNFTSGTHVVRAIEIDPDRNTFRYVGAGATYAGGEWTGGRLHYMPYSVVDHRPFTPIWEAIVLLLSGVIFILGGDAETVSVKDDSGNDLNAFSSAGITRRKQRKPLHDMVVPFKGFSGGGSIASDVYLRRAPHSAFVALDPGLLDARLASNVTFGELARRGALPGALKAAAGDPTLHKAMATRDIKAIANDKKTRAKLSSGAKSALNTLLKPKPASGNVRHAIRGTKKGSMRYAVKHGLTEYLLTAPIARNEAVEISLDDIGTHSATVGIQAAGGKMAKLQLSSRLGLHGNRLKVLIENLAVPEGGKKLQVNVKPGLGGIDIVAAKADAKPVVSVETTIDGRVETSKFTLPFSGGIRLRPWTTRTQKRLKVGAIESLFGPLRDASTLE